MTVPAFSQTFRCNLRNRVMTYENIKLKVFIFFFGKLPRYVSIYSGSDLSDIIPNILHCWNKQERVWHHVFIK